jgi:hypothetical protein
VEKTMTAPVTVIVAYDDGLGEPQARHMRLLRRLHAAASVRVRDKIVTCIVLAEEFLKLEADFINQTIEQGEALRGTATLHDALLMEKLKDEQQSTSGDSGSDRGGY